MKHIISLPSNRTTMLFSLLVVLIVLSAGSFASPIGTNETQTTRPAVQPRWLISFAQFIAHYTGRNPLDYNNYGCW